MDEFYVLDNGRIEHRSAPENWLDQLDKADEWARANAHEKFELTFDTEGTTAGARLLFLPSSGQWMVELTTIEGSTRHFVGRDKGEAMGFFLREGSAFVSAVGAALRFAGTPRFNE